MSVVLGEQGYVVIRRRGEAIRGVLRPGDVDPVDEGFSLDGVSGSGPFITGDRLSIIDEDGRPLNWIDGATSASVAWYAGVDGMGLITLYRSYLGAINGNTAERINLSVPAQETRLLIEVEPSRRNRMLGRITSYELNTERDAVDASCLGDEYRERVSALISGSGQFNCQFSFKSDVCQADCPPELTTFSIYLHQLLMRTRIGSDFDAVFVIGDSAETDSRYVVYKASALVTAAGLSVAPSQVVNSSISFVTTGPLSLRIETAGGIGALLQEDDFYLHLEDESGILQT